MRDRFFDNFKAVLILLVVFAHAIEALIPGWEQNIIIRYIYFSIYCFHMPAFAFVSGFFSNPSRHKNCDSTYKLCVNYLVPYFLMNVLYSILGVLIEGAPPKSILLLFLPQWTMWYLLSMFFWKASLKFFYTIKMAVLISALLALYIGLTQADTFFSISRTVSFFPFFLLGSTVAPKTINKIRSIKKPAAMLVLLCCFALSGLLMAFGPTSALYMMMPYVQTGQTPCEGILFRAAAMAIGICVILCLMPLISEKKRFFTTLGEYSFSVYLLHSGILRIMVAVGFHISNVVVQMIFVCGLTIMICFAFGNAMVNCVVRKTISAVGKIALIKRDEQEV